MDFRKYVLHNGDWKISSKSWSPHTWNRVSGRAEFEKEFVVKENGIQLWVNLERDKNRNVLRSKGQPSVCWPNGGDKTVLNLFSYTGGFFCLCRCWKKSKKYQSGCTRCDRYGLPKVKLDGLDPSKHQGLCVDVFDFLKADQRNLGSYYCGSSIDGPFWSSKEGAWKKKYVEVLQLLRNRVRRGGQLSLSSCTGHISFEDF